MNTSASIPGKVLLVGPAEGVAGLLPLIAGQSWPCAVQSAPGKTLRTLREDPTIDLIILLPDAAFEQYTELCRSIKFDARTGFVSVVFLLPPQPRERKQAAFDAGADDCIATSAPAREVVVRLQKAVRVKHATDFLEDAQAVITALANAIEGKDHYTCGHVERVGAYAVAIGSRLQLSDQELATLKIGGVVHDIGKVGIPDQVLNKPGKLTEEEMDVIRRHPVIGYDILKPLRTFHAVLPIVRWHHERPNGLGYPDGLKGDALPLLPRIISVVDCFDALNTDRPYRKAFTLAECQNILRGNAERGDLDQQLVELFFEVSQQGFLTIAAAPQAA